MEIYKGTSAFSGIAIGKILYYHRGEYQIRQSMVDNVKKELDRLDNARTAVKNQIQHMYKNGAPLPKEQELTLKRQLKLLSGGSFQRAVESMITTEKVSAAYAVQTTRDELANVFRKLEDEAVKEQIENIREISELLIGAMGGSHARINLGDEPVILAAEQLSPSGVCYFPCIDHGKIHGSPHPGRGGDTERMGWSYGYCRWVYRNTVYRSGAGAS